MVCTILASNSYQNSGLVLVGREFVTINSSYNEGNYEVIVYNQSFIQDFKLGGGRGVAKQDDSSV